MLEIQKRISNSFLILLSLPATAMGFALSIQISALSWILDTQYHLSIEEVGFVWAAGPLAGIFGQVIVGLISDNVWFWNGRRRPFILIGGVLAALMLWALPNLGFFQENLGLSLLIIAIIVALTLDISINISFNPTRAIIADVTPEGRPRTRGYTWMQTISGFFGVTAYLIGAFTDKFILIYVGIFLVFFFSVLPPFFITEPRQLQNDEDADDEGTAAKPKNYSSELLKIYFAHGFTWLGVQMMFVYAIFYLKYTFVDFSDAQIGVVIDISFGVMNAVGFILPALVLEPVSNRIGKVRTHTLCIAAMALGYAGIIFFGKTTLILYILMGVVGIGWAATVSLPFAIMTERVDKSKMGLFMGIFNLSVVIPQLIVSLLLGKVVNNFADKNIVFIISAITLAISAVLWTLVKESAASEDASPMVMGGGH